MNNNDLSCFAISDNWAERDCVEEVDPTRSCFARDRDRILYSKEFRRLSGKTQVFVSGFDDHCRTRLTHTLEVVQIATTISKNLGLNVELTEAIAYGHDVGHTPFGHVGERFLNLVMNGCYVVKGINKNLPKVEKGFKHNWQGIRVVSYLEKYKKSLKGYGINLTNYTKWGILNHTSIKINKKCDYLIIAKGKKSCGYLKTNKKCLSKGKLKLDFYNQYVKDDFNKSWSYEAFVVAIADEIAQRHHDVEDGLEANIIDKKILLKKVKELFEPLDNNLKELIGIIRDENDKEYIIQLFSKLIVDFLVRQVIINSKKNLVKLKKDRNINNQEDFKNIKANLNIKEEKKRISYGKNVLQAENKFQKFLFEIIISSHLAQKMDGKASFLLRQLIKAYITNPQQLPDKTIYTVCVNLQNRIIKYKKKDKVFKKLGFNYKEFDDMINGNIRQLRSALNKLHTSNNPQYNYTLLRTICDYIAGMTDKFAIQQYESLYESKMIHVI